MKEKNERQIACVKEIYFLAFFFMLSNTAAVAADFFAVFLATSLTSGVMSAYIIFMIC
jgi:hypothetical protein